MSEPLHRSPAFQFYADDFLAGTLDLSQEEVGAYIRLLCHQWNRGSIPVETEKQQRLAGGSVSVDVLAKFRLVDGSGLVNDRLEKERAKQAEFRQKQREKGLLSAEARKKQPRFNHGSTAVGTAVQPSGQPDTQPEGNSPVSSLQSPGNTPPKAPKGAEPVGFDEFWKTYPKKVAKPAAMKAWRRINPNDETFRKIMESVKSQSVSADWTKDGGQYIPHPATYLNGRRWEDDVLFSTDTKGELLRKIQANRGFPNHPNHANATEEEKALHATMSAKYKAME